LKGQGDFFVRALVRQDSESFLLPEIHSLIAQAKGDIFLPAATEKAAGTKESV
jgi:hypothetical protein